MNRNLTCLRCNVALEFVGRREYYYAPKWGFGGVLAELMTARERFDLYNCPRCGKVELYMDIPPTAVAQAHSEAVAETLAIPLAEPPLGEPISREQLLKIDPDSFVLTDLYSRIGQPMAIKRFPSGVALQYPSEQRDSPHIVLVDELSRRVKMVAIFDQQHIFSPHEWEERFDTPELAANINGCDHYFFMNQGLAFVAEGRNKEDVLYLQLLPITLTLADYQRLEGYSQETFAHWT